MAFTHMEPVKRRAHLARGSTHEICVYRVIETGEHRVYVAKDGFSIGRVVATAEEDVVRAAAKTTASTDIVQALLDAVIDDIDSNEFDEY
jgi:hypothetical protein